MSRVRVDPNTIPLIARRLRVLREAVAGNQAEFCRRVGISQTAWNNYERGRARLSINAATKIREALKIPTDWIYFGDTVVLEAVTPRQTVEAIRAVEVRDEAAERDRDP